MANESARFEVFVQPFPNSGGSRWLVSASGGAQPVWARSGQELFYLSLEDQLVVVNVLPGATFKTGETRPLLELGGAPSPFNGGRPAY